MTTTATEHAQIADGLAERAQILDALQAFINSRPGLEFANYGDVSAYRSESRAITKDRDQALMLLRYVRWTSIDGAALRAAFRDSYSGRLTLGETRVCKECHRDPALQHDHAPRFTLSYCAGQYYPTEYRRAACAVLASAIWAYWRDGCMPEPDAYRVEYLDDDNSHCTSRPFPTREAADHYAASVARSRCPYVVKTYGGKRAGDYLRAKARVEFGATIARRWFN